MGSLKSQVPDGTVRDVLDWVDERPERAQAALEIENSGDARTTLIAKLEAIASPADEATPLAEEATPMVDVETNEIDVSGDGDGATVTIDGTTYELSPDAALALKQGLDRVVIGLVF